MGDVIRGRKKGLPPRAAADYDHLAGLNGKTNVMDSYGGRTRSC
jgi:hypothetical protein